MKKIPSHGITYIEPLTGSPGWYWGTNYASGDLYEAEEVFRAGSPVRRNTLLFFHYPDGRIRQPVTAGEGQYLGRPFWYDGRVVLLRVDFPAGEIQILRLDEGLEGAERLAVVPLSEAEDCYNLALAASPLMLIRQGMDGKVQILWPERAEFSVGETEVFLFREGERLYCSAWVEDPEYREEVLVRRAWDGEILERMPGSAVTMPGGETWVLE